MSQSRLLTALFALFILAAFVQSATAHYDPKLGRWLERDPSGSARIGTYPNGSFSPRDAYSDGMNLYKNVRSSPVRFVDPFGLDSVDTSGEPEEAQSDDEKACRKWAKEQEALEKKHGKWWDKLLDCPCTIDDKCDPKKWNPIEDKRIQEWPYNKWKGYHPAGTYQRRGKPDQLGGPGQQCIYDEDGKLITGGRSAGTPDWVSPVPIYKVKEIKIPFKKKPIYSPWVDLKYVNEHGVHDVAPFTACRKAGLLDLYHKHRPPNNKNKCPENVKDAY